MTTRVQAQPNARIQAQPNPQSNAAALHGAAHFAGQNSISFSDRRIIEVLAAADRTHRKLLQTARNVPDVLSGGEGGRLVENVELYGSLSLDMDEPQDAKAERLWQQDWPSYYVNSRSDVDFVVELKQSASPDDICSRLQKEGWGVVGQTHVHRFETTQYTLVGSCDEDDGNSGEVYLDITCIKSPAHFNRFKRRQEAFREAFHEVRSRMEAQFASPGALAFDAYIHLLKAFSAKVPGNALTGFQATCIGLFTLQIGHFRLKPTQSIALSLFEGFLRFCQVFYGDVPAQSQAAWSQQALNYQYCAIDLSVGGRWLTRVNMCWRSELYFMATEVKLRTSADERVNVTHSLVPAHVSAEAASLLQRAFSGTFDWEGAFNPIAVSG